MFGKKQNQKEKKKKTPSSNWARIVPFAASRVALGASVFLSLCSLSWLRNTYSEVLASQPGPSTVLLSTLPLNLTVCKHPWSPGWVATNILCISRDSRDQLQAVSESHSEELGLRAAPLKRRTERQESSSTDVPSAQTQEVRRENDRKKD